MSLATVNWFLMEVEAASIYFAPEGVKLGPSAAKSSKGASRCPAVLDRLARLKTVKCPFDIRLRFTGTLDAPEVRLVVEESSITYEKLRNNFIIQSPSDWMNPRFPIIQIPTPYVFKSANECFLNQTFPIEQIGLNKPYRLVEGRFPIDKWLRPLSWAVEWVDVAEDIVLRRGEPWFNISFDSLPLEALVKLQREDVTEEDRKRLLETKDVTAYINGTKSLWRKNAIQAI